jgi:hypothetical protein
VVRELMFVCTDPSVNRRDSALDHPEDWAAKYEGKGIRLLGHLLADLAMAVTVRVTHGRRLITDGPFVETKEWLGTWSAPAREDLTMRHVIPSTGRELRRRRARLRPRGRVGTTRPPGRVLATSRGSARTPCPWLAVVRARG